MFLFIEASVLLVASGECDSDAIVAPTRTVIPIYEAKPLRLDGARSQNFSQPMTAFHDSHSYPYCRGHCTQVEW
jgi:hypothetical protein